VTHAPPSSRPSGFARVVLGPMTRVLNPVIARVAGRRHVRFAAQIHHRGRRSGRPYITPASARRAGPYLIIPLTFGTGSDRCRNVLAAGGCTVRWNGATYATERPQVLDDEAAMAVGGAAFSRLERHVLLPLMGVSTFLLLRILTPIPGDARRPDHVRERDPAFGPATAWR